MKRYKTLLWSIPLTFGLFFVTISLTPRSVALPELFVLGSSAAIDTVVLGPKHEFYIGSRAPIEDEYNSHIGKLRFRVLDREGKELAVKRHERFFFTGKAHNAGHGNSLTVYCGSVFRLPRNHAYPLKIRIESNIGELSGLFWVQSSGSFLPVVVVLLSLFLFSVCAVYILAFKRGHKPDFGVDVRSTGVKESRSAQPAP